MTRSTLTLAERRWHLNFSAEKLIYFVPFAIVVYLIVPPLLLLFVASVRSTELQLPIEPGPWTLSNLIRVFSDADTYLLFRNSFFYAASSVSISLSIAISLVWLLERTDLPARNVVFAVLLVPLAVPGYLKAIGWTFLASPSIGALNVLLRNLLGLEGSVGPLNIYTLSGMIFVSALSSVPSYVLMISGAFRNFDPALEEASEVAGASRFQTQAFVTMPLLRPALLAAAIYFLADALDDFQIPAILGINAGVYVLSTRIYMEVQPFGRLPDYGIASTYALLLFTVALILILLYRRMMARHERFAVVTGKGYRPQRLALGRWKYVCFIGVALYILLAAVLPMLVLIWVSLQPVVGPFSIASLKILTLANYAELWNMTLFRRAVVNTLLIAPLVATATSLLSTLVAWMSLRGQFRGKSIPDVLTFINTAVPGVVLALAVMFVYLSFPFLPIYGSIWILVIAFATRYLSYSVRVMGGAVVQIHKELEEASQVSGASSWGTFGRIMLPLLFPAFMNVWVWIAIHAFREATLAVMLMTPANVVLSSLIWTRWREGIEHGLVAAMSVLVLSLSLVVAFVGRRRLPGAQ